MNRMKRTLLLLLLLPLIIGGEVSAQKKFLFFKIKGKTEQTTSKGKETEYEKLFKKKHTTAKGMIDIHVVDDKIYFELPIKLLEREMLIGSTVTKTSDNGHAIVGSKPTTPLHVKFTKNDTHVQLRQVSTAFTTNNSDIKKAMDISMTSPILDNMKILAYNPDSSAVVIEMTDLFLSDNDLMTPFDRGAGSYAFFKLSKKYNPANSYVTGVKAFEDNVSISTVLSYTFSLTARNGATVANNEPFTTEMTRSIMLLSEKPYRPRMADYRIGVFFTHRSQLADEARASSSIFYANRWNIQPKDTAAYKRGELVEPVKPIVFYIDNTFPRQWKPYVREGVSQWNEVFETIGFKNVVQVKDFPTDDETFDPDNIKYSCIRYAPTNIQNAMGPSWVDPRSGEILMASVYVYHDVIKLVSNWLFVQTSQADPEVRKVEIPQHLVGDAIRYVIAHEVGHCLGFMHNMNASHTIPVDSLRSPSFTQKYGTTQSIMDYARFNYVAQPGDKEKGVKLTPPRFGLYDQYLVDWTYRPVFGVNSAEEEAKITSQWITDALRKESYFRYGKQQFEGIVDPRSQSEDLGDDVIKATTYGLNNLKYISANMVKWIGDEDEDFERTKVLYGELLGQILKYVSHVSGNIGGAYLNEVKAADEMPRFAPLSPEYQKKCLQYLFAMYGDMDWLDESPARAKMTISGSPAQAMRNIIMSYIMTSPVMLSMYEGMDTKAFTSLQAMDMIFDFVWSKSPAVLTQKDITLQNTYVSTLLAMGRFSGGGNSRALVDDEIMQLVKAHTSHSGCSHCSAAHNYAPVSGFEWVPDNRFLVARLNASDLYGYLVRAKEVAQSRIVKSSGATKAHYEMMVKTIGLSLK